MTIPVPEGGGGGNWKPPHSLWSWKAPLDPANYDTLTQTLMYRLLGANRAVFADTEAQLLSTASLADLTGTGLQHAKAASWQGNAGNQYRATLGKLPADLNLVSEYYRRAHTALVTFDDTTFALKSRYLSFQDDLANMKVQWKVALEEIYASADLGNTAIRNLQTHLTHLCDEGWSILERSSGAQQDFSAVVTPLGNAAPHEGVLAYALNALKGLWNSITGTAGAFLAYVNDPTWSNLGKLSTDLAVDAGVVALAAGVPLGLAGLGLIDVDGTLVTVAGTFGDTAADVELAAEIDGTASDVADGHWAAAAFSAWGASKGLNGEIDEAVGEASVLNGLHYDLENGITPDFSASELAELKQLVGDPSNAADVARAAQAADSNLMEAALLKDPASFIEHHFIADPIEGALAKSIDGNGNGS